MKTERSRADSVTYGGSQRWRLFSVSKIYWSAVATDYYHAVTAAGWPMMHVLFRLSGFCLLITRLSLLLPPTTTGTTPQMFFEISRLREDLFGPAAWRSSLVAGGR